MLLSTLYHLSNRCVSWTIVTDILGSIFTKAFNIHGAVMESSESLLYSGYQPLNLTCIFIGSTDTITDLSVDICPGVYEVVQMKPNISKK